MGKKPKHKKAEKRAEEKKIHAEHLQKLGAPPRPIEEEVSLALVGSLSCRTCPRV